MSTYPDPSKVRTITVKLKIDTSRFTAAMERAAAAMLDLNSAARMAGRSWAYFHWRTLQAKRQHRARHHRPEDPRSSAIHAAYDHRRRARRRRR